MITTLKIFSSGDLAKDVQSGTHVRPTMHTVKKDPPNRGGK